MTGQGLMTGKVFSNRYQINDRVGVGGMAEVYRAQDNVLGRLVAVKVMLPQYAAESDFTRRFRQEAAAAANLQSPYIVNVYDWGQDGQTYYIVMEFVRGSDLKTAIQQRGAINQRKVAEIGSQVCQALSVAHHQDIIHRDIKPQNIMVQPDGNVKVMDFGIARAKNSVNDQTSSVLGTAHYISPEQAQGKELTAASDIYSLGVVMYEAVTGKLPFDGPDAVSVALMQVKDYPAFPSEINPDIDPALEDIIMTALEKDPNNRFATANDMRLALNDYLAGRTSSSFTSAQTHVIGAAAPGHAAADGTQVMSPIQDAPVKDAQSTIYNADETKKKKSRKGIVALVCAVCAIAVIAAVAFALFGGSSKADVPNVVGMTQEDAVAAIEAAGFEVGTIDSKYDDSVEEGVVISQTPKGDTEAAEGSTVSLVVSQGVEQVTVPNITNMTIDEARELADEYGLTLSQSSSENSSTVEADHIISQSPESGTTVSKGSTITYVMSLGTASVSVPSVTGYTLAAATSTLENAGFNVTSTEAYSSTVSAGYVISQNPTSGTKIEEGSTVTLTVSLGPEPEAPSSSSSTTTNTGSSDSSNGGSSADDTTDDSTTSDTDSTSTDGGTSQSEESTGTGSTE